MRSQKGQIFTHLIFSTAFVGFLFFGENSGLLIKSGISTATLQQNSEDNNLEEQKIDDQPQNKIFTETTPQVSTFITSEHSTNPLASKLQELNMPSADIISTVNLAAQYTSLDVLPDKSSMVVEKSEDDTVERLLVPLNKYEILRVEISPQPDVYLDELALDTHEAIIKIRADQIFNAPLPIAENLHVQLPHLINQKLDIFNVLSPNAEIVVGLKGKFKGTELHRIDDLYAIQINNLSEIYSLIQFGSEGDWYDLAGRSTMYPFLRSPLDHTIITSYFEDERGNRLHSGIDFAAPIGSEIYASADGIVNTVDIQGGYGKVVKISHPQYGNYVTLYAHLKSFKVSKGQYVHQGDLIGHVGMTGRTTGPHLHYELRREREKVNPYFFQLRATKQISLTDRPLFDEHSNKWLQAFGTLQTPLTETKEKRRGWKLSNYKKAAQQSGSINCSSSVTPVASRTPCFLLPLNTSPLAEISTETNASFPN